MRQLSLLENLLAGDVEFIVIGGMAAVAHGSSQLTRDLDICVPLRPDNFVRLQAALAGLHPRVRAGAGSIPLELTEDSTRRLRKLHVITDEGNLDCLGEVAGVGYYDAAEAESIEIRLGEHACQVLGIEALIRSKEAAGRPRDLLAAQER